MSKRVYYNKLVRDLIPGKIEAAGEKYQVRTINNQDEFEQELLKKVVEEAIGLSRSRTREEFLAEYADLMVVLHELEQTFEFSEADIKLALESNIEKKGKFTKRLFLEWSEDGDYQSSETVQGIRG